MITKEGIKAWLDEEITIDFFKRIGALVVHNDGKVHQALANDQLAEAAKFNAGLDQLREVVDIPEQIKLELEEEKEWKS